MELKLTGSLGSFSELPFLQRGGYQPTLFVLINDIQKLPSIQMFRTFYQIYSIGR